MLLRHPALVFDLGQRLVRLQEFEAIRTANPGAKVSSDARILGEWRNHLELKNGSSIQAGTVLSFGDVQGEHGRISIGERTYVGEYNNLRSGGGRIAIGADCLISQFCTLVATNHGIERDRVIVTQANQSDAVDVVLEDDVWLGAGTTVLPGVVIGRGAVIGAGAVVTRPVPANEIWVGIPARKIGERS